MPSEGFRRHRGPNGQTAIPRHHGFVVRNRETGGKPCRPPRHRNQRNTRTPRRAGCCASPKYGNRRVFCRLNTFKNTSGHP
ncbi:hypothetical protein ACR30T_07315 [Neisseria gonorrhoeae]